MVSTSLHLQVKIQGINWDETTWSSPFVWSEIVTVEVASVNEETCALHHVLCYHTQTVQDVAQLTGRREKKREVTIKTDWKNIFTEKLPRGNPDGPDRDFFGNCLCVCVFV